jgi:flagellar biosynthesis protein FliR
MTDSAFLHSLPGWAFALSIVLARSVAALMLLPGFAEAEIPSVIRAGFALAIAALLVPLIAPDLPPVPDAPLQLLALLANEILAGATLGFMARLVSLSLPVAGQVLSTMIGLSNVLQPDPALGGQATPISIMFGLIAPLLIFTTGLYALPLGALAGSYATWPPGHLPEGGVTAVVTSFSGFFLLALRLAAPFLVAGLLWQATLGLLARLVPNLQVFSLAMPGQILGGILLLGLLAGGLLTLWQEAARDAFATLPGSYSVMP